MASHLSRIRALKPKSGSRGGRKAGTVRAISTVLLQEAIQVLGADPDGMAHMDRAYIAALHKKIGIRETDVEKSCHVTGA
jgi:hypothetical protein